MLLQSAFVLTLLGTFSKRVANVLPGQFLYVLNHSLTNAY